MFEVIFKAINGLMSVVMRILGCGFFAYLQEDIFLKIMNYRWELKKKLNLKPKLNSDFTIKPKSKNLISVFEKFIYDVSRCAVS